MKHTKFQCYPLDEFSDAFGLSVAYIAQKTDCNQAYADNPCFNDLHEKDMVAVFRVLPKGRKFEFEKFIEFQKTGRKVLRETFYKLVGQDALNNYTRFVHIYSHSLWIEEINPNSYYVYLDTLHIECSSLIRAEIALFTYGVLIVSGMHDSEQVKAKMQYFMGLDIMCEQAQRMTRAADEIADTTFMATEYPFEHSFDVMVMRILEWKDAQLAEF